MKFPLQLLRTSRHRRSREGAWIEICRYARRPQANFVAPVRERGLKLRRRVAFAALGSRSREGAWIEIS